MVDLPGHAAPLLAPLELKTGRPHVSHHAQVLLYFLLLASRYGAPVLDGVLWYTGQQLPQLLKHKAVEVRMALSAPCCHSTCIKPTAATAGGSWLRCHAALQCRSTHLMVAQIAALMQQRNRLAAAMVRGGALPPVIRDEHRCRRCFQRQHCALLHRVRAVHVFPCWSCALCLLLPVVVCAMAIGKQDLDERGRKGEKGHTRNATSQAVEGGTEATAGMGPAFAEHTQHLDAPAAAWLAHWHRLVELEEAGLLAKKAELWTVAGTTRTDKCNVCICIHVAWRTIPCIVRGLQCLLHGARCRLMFQSQPTWQHHDASQALTGRRLGCALRGCA